MKHFDPGRRPEGWPEGVPLHPTLSPGELYERHSEDVREKLAAGQDLYDLESRVVTFHEILPPKWKHGDERHQHETTGSVDRYTAEPFCPKPHPYLDWGYSHIQQADMNQLAASIGGTDETGLGDKCLGCRREFGLAHKTGLDEWDRKPLKPHMVAVATFGFPQMHAGFAKLWLTAPYGGLICFRCSDWSERTKLADRACRHGLDYLSWTMFRRAHLAGDQIEWLQRFRPTETDPDRPLAGLRVIREITPRPETLTDGDPATREQERAEAEARTREMWDEINRNIEAAKGKS